MFAIRVTNVNQALARSLDLLDNVGVPRASRNGPVMVAPEPVAIRYDRPWERVLFSPLRNANPFFHFMESLWMLAGRNDLAFPAKFVKQIKEYSDDHTTLHGAYGYRWRNMLTGGDQLPKIVEMLRRNPDDRRAVLQMWSAPIDLAVKNKDVPCNTHVYFGIADGKLNMTVSNRSNDAVWGACGANAVHFAILQQFVADQLGCGVGWYEQISSNFHIYTDKYPRREWRDLMVDCYQHNYYDPESTLEESYEILDGSTSFKPVPMFGSTEPVPLVSALNDFCDKVVQGRVVVQTAYDVLDYAATPMYLAWLAMKDKNADLALHWCKEIKYLDWQLACKQWIMRRFG
jgi:hypothetical protein